MASRNNCYTGIWISSDLLDALDTLKDHLGCSRSKLIRIAITDFLGNLVTDNQQYVTQGQSPIPNKGRMPNNFR